MAEHVINREPPAQIEARRKKLPTLATDMAVGFAACFAAYSVYIDFASYLSGTSELQPVYNAIKLAFFAALVMIWIALSVQNGFGRRHGFLIFTLIFWLLPLAVGLYLSAFDLSKATGIVAIVLNIALLFIKIIVQSPSAGIDLVNEFLPVSGSLAVCTLTAIFTLAFLIAYVAATIKYNKYSDSDEGSGIK
jgi:hypothetical protein